MRCVLTDKCRLGANRVRNDDDDDDDETMTRTAATTQMVREALIFFPTFSLRLLLHLQMVVHSGSVIR